MSPGNLILFRQIFLDNDYRLLPLRVMTDEAAGKIEGEVKSIKLQALNSKAIYQVESITQERLLCLVSREINIELQVDAITGGIIKEQQPWWARLCW